MGEPIYITALIMTYTLCTVLELKRDSPFTILWLALGLIFYFPLTVDFLLQSKPYKFNTYAYIAIFAISFNIIYFISRVALSKTNKFNFEIKATNQNIYFLNICCLFLFLSVVGTIVYYLASGISISTVTWSDKQELGPIMGLMTYFYYFGCISVFLAFLMQRKKTLLLAIFLIVVYILLTQSRAIIIPAVVPFLLYLLVYKKKYTLFFTISLLAMFVFFLLQQIRYAGGLHNFFDSDFEVILLNTRDKILSDNNEFSLINSFYKIVEQPQELNRFGDFATFKRMLMVFYPDILTKYLHIKPNDFTYDIYTHYYGYQQGTFHPTFYGLVYANAKFLIGSISALFFSLIISFFDRLLIYLNEKGLYTLYFSVVVACCHMSLLWARGSIYNGWSQGLFMIVIALLVSFSLNKIKNT